MIRSDVLAAAATSIDLTDFGAAPPSISAISMPRPVDQIVSTQGQVLDSKLGFHAFGEKTSVLLLGSRDGSTELQSINITTILQKCDKRYPSIEKFYAVLSESAHPNYAGMVADYSKIDHDEYETHFSNRWMELHGDRHLGSMELCMSTFHHEYNDVWPALMEKLESWIEVNDAELEVTKNDPLTPA